MPDFFSKPWPWYVAGPLIGLMVPTLLLLGNKKLGISSSLRHICAACLPAGIPFFSYNWKKEAWNLFFAAGILLGGIVVTNFLNNPAPVDVHPSLVKEMSRYGVHDLQHAVPADVFNWNAVLSLRGFVLMIVGGFLVGFGTRYAGGCTSGHAIMGLSNLQWPSLVATICFMIGGIIFSNWVVPVILKW